MTRSELSKIIGIDAYLMTDEVISFIERNFEKIYNSPYSLSIYSAPKTWDNTINGSYTVTDHFNFFSSGKWHKLTTMPVKEIVRQKFGQYSGYQNDYIYIAQFDKDATPYLNAGDAAEKGAWVILDVYKKDFEAFSKELERRMAAFAHEKMMKITKKRNK